MSNIDIFTLPKDGRIYTRRILERCRKLIEFNVWSGIQQNRLDLWFNNFEDDTGKYFAARVLDSLIYRSNDQTTSLMRHLFQVQIPKYARQNRLPEVLHHPFYHLQDQSIVHPLKIVPVIPQDEGPAKSGPIIARMYRRNLRFGNNYLIHPNRMYSAVGEVECVIFVDDFLGTGQQFSRFLQEIKLESISSECCFVYAPLVRSGPRKLDR